MKKKFFAVALLGTLATSLARLIEPQHALALPNAMGLINEHGIESLLIDPASANLPFPNPLGRFLLMQRGASGAQYCDICAGGPGGSLPLGPSADAAWQVNDVLNVRRLGARPGLEVGIVAAGTAVTVDNLLVSAAGGKVQDITTLAVNGTYWVVGRAAQSLTVATATVSEVGYVPVDPFQIVNTGGTITFPTNPK